MKGGDPNIPLSSSGKLREVAMNYTYQWVHRLHGEALKEFEKVMNNEKS